MPKEMVSGSLAATAAVPTQIVMNANDSRVVRFFSDGKKAYLLGIWCAGHTTDGPVVVKSPKLHDNNLGIHYALLPAGAKGIPLFPLQPMYSQDNLDILLVDTLGAGDWDNLALEFYYEDLQGNNGNYINAEALKGKIKNIVTINVFHAVAGAVGYQTDQNITAVTDLLKGNTNYALIGYKSIGDQFAAGFRGPCTGNMRIMLPCNQNDDGAQADYFIKQSNESGLPCIPVLNSADRYGTFVDFLENVGGTLNSIDLIFAELT